MFAVKKCGTDGQPIALVSIYAVKNVCKID